MERREFLTVAGMAAATTQFRIANFGLRICDSDTPSSKIRNPQSTIRNQSPTLGPQVFSQRIQRAQDELKARKLDLLVVEPSTNFQYFTGYNPGRSERLILLMIPAGRAPVIVCPSFEVERIKRNTVISDARGWEEHENPWTLVGKAAGPSGVVGIEPTTSYQSYRRLARTLPGWRFEDGALVTERLRIIKSPFEIQLMEEAAAVCDKGLEAAFRASQRTGATENDIASATYVACMKAGADRVDRVRVRAGDEVVAWARWPFATARRVVQSRPSVRSAIDVTCSRTWCASSGSSRFLPSRRSYNASAMMCQCTRASIESISNTGSTARTSPRTCDGPSVPSSNPSQRSAMRSSASVPGRPSSAVR